uniref:Apt1 n=1 Tax=Arundo donax TaxID=35708 RepID=A0A0A9GZ65_ARUDO
MLSFIDCWCLPATSNFNSPSLVCT